MVKRRPNYGKPPRLCSLIVVVGAAAGDGGGCGGGGGGVIGSATYSNFSATLL